MQTKYRPRFAAKDLPVLYEDKDLLIVDKPVGLLSVATEREKTWTVHSLLTEYIRKGAGRSKKRIFIVHRLDRDTSGLLIFAKSEEAMLRLKERWKETEKKYLAVVHGRLEKDSGTITSYLAEDEDYTMYSTAGNEGKLARTAYRVMKETSRYSLIEVTLLTGRKNQIRVHMAEIGHPVVGDIRYGKPGDENQPRMALHARSLSFQHPFIRRQISIVSEVPEFFVKLVGKIEGEVGP